MGGSLCRVYLIPHKSAQLLQGMSILKVKKLVVYERDCTLHYAGHDAFNIPDCGRNEINQFTKDSRRRLAFVASNCNADLCVMVTLTYPRQYPTNGKIVKRHFKLFKDSLLRSHPASYLWCLEFQKRGAPHYHILLDNPDILKHKQWVSNRWYEIVDSKDPKHLLAGTRCERMRTSEGGRRYIVKYAQKMRQKKVPEAYRNVGRFWGHSRDLKPEPIGEIELIGGEMALQEVLGSWPYKNVKLPIKTLYNASGSVLDVVQRRFNNESAHPVYASPNGKERETHDSCHNETSTK